MSSQISSPIKSFDSEIHTLIDDISEKLQQEIDDGFELEEKPVNYQDLCRIPDSGYGKIMLPISFLDFVWVIGYHFNCLFREIVNYCRRNEIDEPTDDELSIHEFIFLQQNRVIQRSDRLYQWSKEIGDKIRADQNYEHDKWPEGLPSPKFPSSFSWPEIEYMEQANRIFVYTMNFILLHECTHLIVEDNSLEEVSVESQDEELKEAVEQAADDLAIEQFTQNNQRLSESEKCLGIMIYALTELFVNWEIGNIFAGDHPDYDERILSLLDNFDSSNRNINLTYVVGLVAGRGLVDILGHGDKLEEVDSDQKPIELFKELLRTLRRINESEEGE